MNTVTKELGDFYDRYPYPPPIKSLEEYRRLWEDSQRRRADHHLFWPAQPYSEDRSVLIAGCGTSQAAKHALRWPAAQIIGIDISATSVRCTDELKTKYALKNLQVHLLPIERVDELRMSFNLIVCTGVLHHLVDPEAGLSALRKVLKPGGVMQLMLYAPYGRAGVYMLQEFCRRMSIRATDEGIRELVDGLRWLPDEHPLANLLREAPDFQRKASLADALLHPQDRAYSVPQLFDFVEKTGLTFGRWVRQAPYTPRCGVVSNIPQAFRMLQLPLPEQYAAVELFRGTMVRHSLVAHLNGTASVAQHVNFSGDAWLNYVPIRMSDTICVQEQLPPGVTAVLINRSHTYKDLFMPIDSIEKSLFDAIDGEMSIGDLVERTLGPSTPESPLNKARDLFERLWWYDQAVFDSSAVREQPTT